MVSALARVTATLNCHKEITSVRQYDGEGMQSLHLHAAVLLSWKYVPFWDVQGSPTAGASRLGDATKAQSRSQSPAQVAGYISSNTLNGAWIP
jgi:hypothetical protein